MGAQLNIPGTETGITDAEVRTMLVNIERVNAQLDELAKTAEPSRAEELRSQIREQIQSLIWERFRPMNATPTSCLTVWTFNRFVSGSTQSYDQEPHATTCRNV